MSTTDLISAINKQNILEVKQLIRNKVDVDVCSFEGESALQLSIRTEQQEICGLLLKAKANPDFQNSTNGTTALHSIFEGYSGVGLEKYIMFTWLLMKHPNTDAKDINGNTPLHEAAKCGSDLGVEDLLKNHANCHACFHSNYFIMQYAAESFERTWWNY